MRVSRVPGRAAVALLGPILATPALATPAVAAAPTSVRYSFDAGPGLRALGRNGATVTLIPHGTGRAAQFPTASAARAILEGADDPRLDPGARPFRWGATVRLAATGTSAGQNVVQKGTAGTGSQWKLQVDGSAGRPGCVLVGAGRWYVATASVSVADGRWHGVVCTRTASTLVTTVDGVVRGRVRVPGSVAVSNAAPLRVGGKGVGRSNDQYRGAVDDVFYDRY
jgi:hypothetical protein